MEKEWLLKKIRRWKTYRWIDGKKHLLENLEQGAPNREINQKIRHRIEQNIFI